MADKFYLSRPWPGFGGNPPPGLLLSLGDGSAVERSAEQLARAMAAADCADFDKLAPNTARDLVDHAGRVLRCFIQQAQEARDASKPKPVVGCRCNGLGCRRCEGDTL
jgi:hypothetical protein